MPSKRKRKKQLPDAMIIKHTICLHLVRVYGGTTAEFMNFGTDRLILIIGEFFRESRVNKEIVEKMEEYTTNRLKKEPV